MADHTMATVLFCSVFVFLFFKFCLGAPPLGPVETVEVAAEASNLADSDLSLPLVRKCPVGSVYSVATGDCKDLVRSTKDLSQRLQLLMPYLLAATQNHQH